ncbi:hypothetical protein [Nitrosomonas sp.]
MAHDAKGVRSDATALLAALKATLIEFPHEAIKVELYCRRLDGDIGIPVN